MHLCIVTHVTTLRGLPRRTLAGLVTLAAAAFVAVTTETLPTGLLPQIGAGFHVSQAEAGTLIGVYALVVALGSVPLAIVTNRLPRKALILFTLSAYGLSAILTVATSSFAVAVGSRVIGGVAHALFFAVASAYVARLVPPHLIGRAVAVLQTGGSLALVAGVPLGTAIGLAAGWRSAFLVLAAAGLLLMVAAWRLLPPVASSAPVSWGNALNGLRAPGLGAIAVVSMIAFAGHYSAYTYIAHLLHRGGIGPNHVSGVLLLFGLGGMVGVWISGLSADRFPRAALTTSFAALPATMLLLWASKGFAAGTVLAVIVWAMAFVAIPTVIMTSALRAGHRHPDMASALINSSCNIGISTGALSGGVVLSSAGLSGLPLLSAGLFLAALAVAVLAGRVFSLPTKPVASARAPVPAQAVAAPSPVNVG
jgi:predicted MFS family arabinose efflux permease